MKLSPFYRLEKSRDQLHPGGALLANSVVTQVLQFGVFQWTAMKCMCNRLVSFPVKRKIGRSWFSKVSHL